MTRFLRYALIIGGALMSILLFLLTTASDNSARLEPYYKWLLAANVVVALALLALIVMLLWRLFSRYRNREFGSRLMTRLVLLFALVGILPGSVIYVVSVNFVSHSIESWFDVKVESAMESGKNLGLSAMEFLLADLQAKARDMSSDLSSPSDTPLSIQLYRLREKALVQDAVIVNSRGRVVASSSQNTGLIPEVPTPDMLRQARSGRMYAAIDEKPADADTSNATSQNGAKRPVLAQEPAKSLRTRVVVQLHSSDYSLSMNRDTYYLQLIHPVPASIALHAEAVRSAASEYQVRSLGRSSLKTMYVFTLTLTLLVSVFAAITSAFFISGQLARPLLLLAEGTKAVTEGDFSPRPIISTTDELGSLTQSFNTMTRQLLDARTAVERNRSELENAKAYLESVLANMSAGVMVLDEQGHLVTCNESVERILQRPVEGEVGKALHDIPGLDQFAAAIDKAFAEQQMRDDNDADKQEHWQQQIEIPRPDAEPQGEKPADAMPNNVAQNITLLARGSHLPVGAGEGYVIVFDDITKVISAQRSIAWGEVARRLAHEIKNPLTPIQLSAERLQMKLEEKLSETDAAILRKGTTTIVNQVSSMKRMVDDFRDYARTPPAVLSQLDLNALIDEVLHLYLAGDGRDIIRLSLAAGMPKIMGDATQLRQVIHNLLQNAQDAIGERTDQESAPRIDVSTELVRMQGKNQETQLGVRLLITDNGPGFSSKILARAFEPYATSKPRGTGLGLPMVKKIIDEHGGRIDIQNRTDTNGAKVSILLLKLAPDSSPQDGAIPA
ncbi:sensor histidine kinase [Undibacterium squillarum]|nr:ATP-binding protein [Undibacterium squillarum]